MIDRSTIHPALLAKVDMISPAMALLGFPVVLAQGARTAEYQHELWRQGRETVGPNATPQKPLGDTVTNCDGYTTPSPHQIKADGYGHAVDFCFTKGEPFGEHQPWALLGAMAEALGLTWGGHWTTRVDRPHVELK